MNPAHDDSAQRRLTGAAASSPAPRAPAPSRLRRALRWAEHVVAGGSVFAVLLALSPVPKWIYRSFDRAGDLQPARYAIALGGDMDRVIEAARLVREGAAEKLIVSNHGEAAEWMRQIALDWGAPPDRILVDDRSVRTADHPAGAVRLGVDPQNDVCIIVTTYTHLARAEAVFQRAGFRRIVLREPRWHRYVRDRAPADGGMMWRWMEMPSIVYESAAWVRYWLAGQV